VTVRAGAITARFLDVGGVLLTNGWNRLVISSRAVPGTYHPAGR
jgi:hypothetical protein